MNGKKAQELSLQTVIIAVILLIVLVVVIFIFVKYTGQEGKVVNDSISNVADCIPGSPEYLAGKCKLLGDLNTDSTAQTG